MSGHEVRTMLREGWGDLHHEFRCNDEHGVCWQTCTQECESWASPVLRDGVWWHPLIDEPGEHRMTDYGQCIAVEWVEAVGSNDAYIGPDVEVRAGWVPVEFRYEDGYGWRYPEAVPT